MATAKKPSAAPKKMGRPSLYSEAIVEKICSLIEQGLSERQIAKMDGMPCVSTMGAWKDTHPEFLLRSARAREASAQMYDDRRREMAQWLIDEAKTRAATGKPFPKGIVEAIRTAMQEDARSAGQRDDRNFGDRRRVDLTGKLETTVAPDLSGVDMDKLRAARELLYGDKTSDPG